MPAKKPTRKPTSKSKTVPYVKKHRDGTLWAKGQTQGGKMTGYWEWYRKDGSLMRSGHFAKGVQSGEWTTYAANGRVVKVTVMKGKKK